MTLVRVHVRAPLNATLQIVSDKFREITIQMFSLFTLVYLFKPEPAAQGTRTLYWQS